MKLALACTLALAATAFAFPAASAADAGKCVNYAYVADYHWYYVCVDPKDASCVVSTKEQHGTTVTEECYGVGLTTSADPVCTEYIGDLDHRWRYCVDAGSLKCPVYVEQQSGARDCLP